MAVIKEWTCKAHGAFEGTQAECPHGCSGEGMISRAFRTAPSIQTAGYRSVNGTIESLAAEHGLTDINQRGGDGMLKTDWRARKRLQDSVEMMGHGDRAGQDMSKFFVPTANLDMLGQQQGALRRDPTTGGIATVMDGQIVPLPKPGIQVAGSFDGKGAGLPKGDA